MYQLAQTNYGQWKQDVTPEVAQKIFDRSEAILNSITESGGFV